MRRVTPLLSLLVLLNGCAMREQIVLLTPDSRLEVTTKRDSVVLTGAQSVAEVSTLSRLKVVSRTSEAIQALFNAALHVFPRPTVVYTVYFQTGATSLTLESERVFQDILEQMHTTQALEIEVTGHTDTQGSSMFNDSLSLERARVIEARIVAAQPPLRTLLRAVGRGERELLIPTPDDTDEAINRRVELRLR